MEAALQAGRSEGAECVPSGTPPGGSVCGPHCAGGGSPRGSGWGSSLCGGLRDVRHRCQDGQPRRHHPGLVLAGKWWVRIPGVLWAGVADLPIVLGGRRTPRKFPRGSDKDGNQGWGLSGGARSPDVLLEPMQAETCERPPLERAVFRWLMSLGSAVTTALAAAAGAGRAPDPWTQASRGLSGCSVTLQRRAGVPRTET